MAAAVVAVVVLAAVVPVAAAVPPGDVVHLVVEASDSAVVLAVGEVAEEGLAEASGVKT